ncbi:hypothetical protein QQ045_010802 [Rhodiola kirilowii]
MTILSWNCRGMGNPRTIRELRSLIRATNPQVIGLIETKADKKKMERIRVLLGFFGCFVVPAKGASGGLALLWRREYTYSDRRKGARECKSRLDRVLVSQGWLHEYPEAINTHMFTYSSD